MALTASQKRQLEDAKSQLQQMQKTLDQRKANEAAEKVSYGKSSSGKELSSKGSQLNTSSGQSLKDYSIAFGGGGSSGSKITSDSSDATNDENAVKTEYDDAALRKLQRDRERQIEKERAALEDRRDKFKDEINTNFDERNTGLEYQQSRESAAKSNSLARMGGYLGNDTSHEGAMQNLQLVHRDEIDSLENERQATLNQANNAYEDRDFELARELLQTAEQTEQEIYNRTQEFNAQIQDLTTVQNDKLIKAEEQRSIYNAILTTGKDSVEDIFAALDGTVTVDSIREYLDGVSGASSTTSDGYKFSSGNTASLLGAGMGQDDIRAFNDYVNENGYDDAVRSALSPQERAAADKIFRDIKTVTGSTSGNPTEVMSLLDLQRIQDTYDVLFPYGITTGEVTQFFEDNKGKDSVTMQKVIDLVFGDGEGAAAGGGTGGGTDTGVKTYDTPVEFNEEWLRKNLNDKELHSFAEAAGAARWWRAKSMDLLGFINSDIDQMFEVPEFWEELNKVIAQMRVDDPQITDEEIVAAITS